MVTTKTIHEVKTVDGITIEFVPTSLYAYELGRNLLEDLRMASGSNARSSYMRH